MKKTITVAILFLSMINIAQKKENRLFKTISLGFDVRNCIIGSNPTNNKPELDFIIGAGFIQNKLEFNFGFESFKAIDFNKYTFSVGPQIKIKDNFKFIPALEYTNIYRSENWGGALSKNYNSYFSSIALNLSLRYYFNDKIGLEYMINILPRTDLLYQYDKLKIVSSGYIKFVYVLELIDKKNKNE